MLPASPPVPRAPAVPLAVMPMVLRLSAALRNTLPASLPACSAGTVPPLVRTAPVRVRLPVVVLMLTLPPAAPAAPSVSIVAPAKLPLTMSTSVKAVVAPVAGRLTAPVPAKIPKSRAPSMVASPKLTALLSTVISTLAARVTAPVTPSTAAEPAVTLPLSARSWASTSRVPSGRREPTSPILTSPAAPALSLRMRRVALASSSIVARVISLPAAPPVAMVTLSSPTMVSPVTVTSSTVLMSPVSVVPAVLMMSTEPSGSAPVPRAARRTVVVAALPISRSSMAAVRRTPLPLRSMLPAVELIMRSAVMVMPLVAALMSMALTVKMLPASVVAPSVVIVRKSSGVVPPTTGRLTVPVPVEMVRPSTPAVVASTLASALFRSRSVLAAVSVMSSVSTTAAVTSARAIVVAVILPPSDRTSASPAALSAMVIVTVSRATVPPMASLIVMLAWLALSVRSSVTAAVPSVPSTAPVIEIAPSPATPVVARVAVIPSPMVVRPVFSVIPAPTAAPVAVAVMLPSRL